MNVIMLGDSITRGYTPDGDTPYPLSKTIADKTGYTVFNAGVDGAQVSVGNGSFDTVVNRYNFGIYDMVIIMYGTNDFGWQDETIDQFKTGYQQALDKIRNDSSTIKIKLVTPIHEFAFANGDLNFKNNHGVSQNMISDAVVEVAQKNHVDVFDWRQHNVVTDKSQLYPDGTHPRDETYKAMGEALADWIGGNNSSNDQPASEITSVVLSHVDSPFTIKDNVTTNYQKCLDVLKTIYQKVSRLIGDEYTFNPIALKLNDDIFNRTMWLYIVHVFDQLKMYTNEAIGIFRSNGFANIRTKKDFEDVKITRPISLLIDTHYQNVLNDNWAQIETALNDLLNVLKKFHMMKEDK